MKKIKVKATLSNLRVGESPIYRMIPEEPTKIGEEEFLGRMADMAGQDKVQGRYWLDAFRDALFQGLGENAAIDLNFLHAKLHVAGSLPVASAQPSKEANPVRPRIFLKGPLADGLKQLEVENDTRSVPAILYEVMQDGARDVNRIESVTARVVINGSEIKIDPNQPDNGVWLEDLKTGVKIAEATVSYSDASTCHCAFPTLPATGRYRLVLATRNGESPDEYALAKVTRNVYVVHEANN